MEAETLASRNIVDLLMREKFNASICPLEEGWPGYVSGWDCYDRFGKRRLRQLFKIIM